MSGPKSIRYRVSQSVIESALRREAESAAEAIREHSEALAERRNLVSRMENLKIAGVAWQAEGLSETAESELMRVSSRGSLENIESSANEIKATNRRAALILDQAEARLETLQSRERRESRRRALAALETDPENTTPGTTVDHSFDREAELADLTDMIPSGVLPAERDSLKERFSALARATGHLYNSYLVAAKSDIQAVRRAVADRSEGRRRAEDLLPTLAGLSGADVNAARSLLEGVIAGAKTLLDSDVITVERVREAARQDYKRRFVASRVEKAFEKCGFEIGVGFSSDVITSEETYIPARSSGDHAVAVRMDQGLLNLRVVRSAGRPDATSDAAAEVGFCKDLGQVSAEMNRLGVELELESYHAPGEEPVPVVADARKQLASRSVSHRQKRPRTLQR